MLPKNYLDKFKLRHKAEGNERRRNITKTIMEHAANFPQPVEYADIDQAFQKWVEEALDIAYNGQRIPTFRLFSNQRINEYAQTWQHLDEVGNLLLNFKTITRDNNPKKGQQQGSSYNIPGDRTYPMFMVPVLQENGQQAFDRYSMKQPFCVDMAYTVNIITNHYEVLNEMNQMVHNEFKAINAYIAPHGHFMPMILEDISDESEYAIDDRKYYSQSYKILIKAYIIKEEDFEVTRVPSRSIVRMLGISEKKQPKIEIQEEDYNWRDENCPKREDDRYYNRKISVIINLPECTRKAEFEIDTDFVLEEIKLDNVYDFVLTINKEEPNFENEVFIYDGDSIKVLIERDDNTTESIVTLVGYDPHNVVDRLDDPESSLDEPIDEEEIIVNA